MSSIKFFILQLNSRRSESCSKTLSKSAGEIEVERSSLWPWALKLNPVQFSVLSSFESSVGFDCHLIVNYTLLIFKKFMFLLQNHLHELKLAILWQSSSKVFENLVFKYEIVAVVLPELSYHVFVVLRIIQNPSFLMKIRKSLNGLSAQSHPFERSSCSWVVCWFLVVSVMDHGLFRFRCMWGFITVITIWILFSQGFSLLKYCDFLLLSLFMRSICLFLSDFLLKTFC